MKTSNLAAENQLLFTYSAVWNYTHCWVLYHF